MPSARLPFARLPFAAALLAAACALPSGAAAQTGAHLDAMSREHAGHTPAANGAALPPRQEVAAREVAYAVNGQPVKGYEARPASAGEAEALPAIILVHEWWGLNENVRMSARRLAGEGFRVFAVDMYLGRLAEDPRQARALMQEVMDDSARGLAHLSAAAESLRRRTGTGRIGIMGWCFGGGWALQGALGMPDRIDAAVMYYGSVITDEARLAKLDAPLLGLFGGADTGIPVPQVLEMHAALRRLGKDATVRVYPGASHGFANPSGQGYDAAPAEDAWRRTVEFFTRHLR